MARVLLIEDERDVRELYRLVLEDGGHKVLGEYADVDRALTAMANREVDVVVLDERVGGTSGSQRIPTLRRAFPGVRILLATADPVMAARGQELGADAALEKPFPVKDLSALVTELAGS